MKQKLSILLLAATLASVGCQSESGSTEITASAFENTSGTEAVTEAYILPIANYNGATFTIAGRENQEGSWAIQGKKAYTQEEETGDVFDDALYRRRIAVSENYGVNLEFFPYDVANPSNIINSLLAGDNVFDVIECNAWYINKFLAYPQLFVDFLSTDVVDLNNPWWEKSAVEEFSIGGKLYAITGDISLIHPLSTAVIYFNKQIVEDYSLDDPYSLVRDGKWTLDVMQEMAVKVTHDIDGDGEIHMDTDRLGLMASDTSLIYFIRAAGFDMTSKNAEDLPELTLYSERNVDIMTKVQAILRDTDHNFNMAISTLKSGPMSGDGFYNYVLPSFKSGRGLFHFNWLFIAMDLRDMEIDFGMLPLPKYDEAQEEYISLTCDNWDTFEMIPYTDEERVERAGVILEALGYYGMEQIVPATIEKTIGDKLTRDDHSLETINIVSSAINYDIASIFDWGGLVAFFRNFGNKTNAEFSSAYTANESKIKNAMELTIKALTE